MEHFATTPAASVTINDIDDSKHDQYNDNEVLQRNTFASSGPKRRYDELLFHEGTRTLSDTRIDRLGSLNKELISHGDLLFFRGDDAVSVIIEMGCDTLFSHVGTAIKVSPNFIQTLSVFIKNLSDDWEEIGFNLLKENYRNQTKTQRYAEEENKDYNDDGDDNDERFGDVHYEAFKEYTYGNELKNPFNSHIRRMLCAYKFLRTNSKLVEAITSEINYARTVEDESYVSAPSSSSSRDVAYHGLGYDNDDEGEGGLDPEGNLYTFYSKAEKNMTNYDKRIPRSDDTRELYLWESTTDEEVPCVLTGKTSNGVKLTLLKERTWGYQNVVGIRRVMRTLDKFASAKGSHDLRLVPMYYGFVCNVMLNHTKPYQEDYADMLWSLCYVKNMCCCFSFFHSDSRSSDNGCCCTCLFSDDYHTISEYDSFYCTELSMELLLDYMIMQYVASTKSGVGLQEKVTQDTLYQISRSVSLQRSASRGNKSQHSMHTLSSLSSSSWQPNDKINKMNSRNSSTSLMQTIVSGFSVYELISALITGAHTYVASGRKKSSKGGGGGGGGNYEHVGGLYVDRDRNIDLITSQHYNQNRNVQNSGPQIKPKKMFGAPRTNVEMDYMINVDNLPVTYRVSPIEMYKRVSLSIGKKNRGSFDNDDKETHDKSSSKYR